MSDSPLPENCRVDPEPRNSIIKPYVLGHGTLECFSLAESRRFYEEFLGLECVRHAAHAALTVLVFQYRNWFLEPPRPC